MKERQTAGQALIWTKICVGNRGHALAIRRTFRSWKNAMIAAGLQDAD